MAPKHRQKDKHLPQRVYHKHGAYYYVDTKNKWHKLGKDFTEAMANWSKMMNPSKVIYTMNQLFDRYMIEIAPLKSKKSYTNNQYEIKNLRVFFGEMEPAFVKALDIYKYMDIRATRSKIGANREKSLLSHCFAMGIRWGVVMDNPCRNVKRFTEKPRTRYAEDWEYDAVKTKGSPFLRLVMDFAYLSGQRIGDILTIGLNDITESGIFITQNKTGAKIEIEMTEDLKKCVDACKRLQTSNVRGMALFSTKDGKPYTYSGFASAWKRAVKKALAEGLIQETFTFHDIRAKTRSDSNDGKNASELLGHSNQKITERVYNRKHKKVRPLR